jgi:DNA-binding IclR family transcriptional regulator
VAQPEDPAHADQTVIGRVFAILDAFRGEMVLGIRPIARNTGLPPATVHRLVSQLVELDVLSKVGNQYRLGVRLFEVGLLHYPSKLRNALNPFLVDLQRATGADVSTNELTGRFVVVVDHVPARNNATPYLRVGARIAAHATAAGKAIMAQSHQVPYDRDDQLTPLTPKTIKTLGHLESDLARTRTAGVAYEHGEADRATNAVAAPLLNRHGRILGALMVSSAAPGFVPENAAAAVATLARTLTRVGASTNIPFYAKLPPAPP